MDDRALPQTGLLGRHPYTVMITESGSGASRSGGLLVNRWRNDLATDEYGQWCYLMNVGTGDVWSSGIQPTASAPDFYEAAISSSGARFSRTDGHFNTVTEIVAHLDRAAESRRVAVTNRSELDAVIEITSYQEIVIAPAISDRGHRAFSNLFVQTEWLPELTSLLAMRRPRSSRIEPVWCGHTVSVEGDLVHAVSCETDRARFLGRGRSSRNPAAMDTPGALSGTSGAALDPVFALRVRIPVAAGQTVEAVFSTFAAGNRSQAVEYARHFTQPVSFPPVLGETDVSDVVLAEVGLGPEWKRRIESASLHLIYGTGRPATGTREDLLKLGLAGEWPIALARIAYETDIGDAGDVVKLHRYWTLKGIPLDLVILCATSVIADAVRQMVLPEPHAPEGGPSIVILNAAALDPSQVSLLDSLARVRLVCSDGSVQVSHA